VAKKVGGVALILALFIFLSGCSQGVSIFVSPQTVIVGGGQTTHFTASVLGRSAGVAWSVNGEPGGNATVGRIDGKGDYTAPLDTSAVVKITASSLGGSSRNAAASAAATVVAPGSLASTNHPQVALYRITLPHDAEVYIQFGVTTEYGLMTWTQPTPSGGGAVSILVAGMLANTTYHMRANVQFSDGSQFLDADHTFTTGGLPALAGYQFPQLTVATTSGLAPQSGVELLDLVLGKQPEVVVTDITGNVIWWYLYTGSAADTVQPIKMLPNGHFLLVITPTSSAVLRPPPPPGTLAVVREIDLAGDTIREISLDTLNSRLVSNGFDLVAATIHHDILPLPNGHWILLVNSTKQFTDLAGIPGPTTVLGDAIVDLDANWQPFWIWDSFDHLDVNRHPMSFPDWTHSNAILYSRDDGNLLLSMRHQHWIVKIDYKDGRGTGDIIWRLGHGGDFTLQNGTDPTDWFYAQHNPSFITPNTTGTFSLMMFDNGNDRLFPAGVTCGSSGALPCLYSTVPMLQIDEAAKTASLLFHYTTPHYSLFGGNAEQLGNGDIEFNESSLGLTSPFRAAVFEITQQPNPQIVWQMSITGSFAYRAFRMPSLYPGVQW